MKRSRYRTALIAGVAYLVALIFLTPYLVMFLTSLKGQSELQRIPADYFPRTWNWRNYPDVWTGVNRGEHQVQSIAGYMGNTLIIAGGATLIVLLVSLPAAYYTARNRYRGRNAFLLLVLVTQMFAPTALVIGIYREVVALDMANSYLAVILVNAAFNLAFCIWIMTDVFSGIPAEIEEAAALDGATRMQILRRVTLPLAAPGIITAIIFTFIAAWNEFVVALTLTSDDKHPLTVGVTGFIGLYSIQWQYLFAASLIAIVPVVILFASIERHLVSGLTAGAVK